MISFAASEMLELTLGGNHQIKRSRGKFNLGVRSGHGFRLEWSNHCLLSVTNRTSYLGYIYKSRAGLQDVFVPLSTSSVRISVLWYDGSHTQPKGEGRRAFLVSTLYT